MFRELLRAGSFKNENPRKVDVFYSLVNAPLPHSPGPPDFILSFTQIFWILVNIKCGSIWLYYFLLIVFISTEFKIEK